MCSTRTSCRPAKMAEAQGGTKEKDWAKKKQNKGFMKASKIFKAPKTTVVEDSGAGSPHHHRQTSNQPFSPGSPPLGKQNYFPPELLKNPWRSMEQDDLWGEKVSVS